jgi:phage head maturation protease
MFNKDKADFKGYATKCGLKCSDGRTIMKDAFKHQDGAKVPLVWQHLHDEPDNILGHAYLENREDGVFAYGFFNETEKGQNAKALVQHGDICYLSIYANNLKEKAKNVIHGAIREVSLVLAGANPGATITDISLAHAEDDEDANIEVIIRTGLTIEHSALEDDDYIQHADPPPAKKVAKEKTIGDVFNTLNEEQKNVVYALIAYALGGGEMAQSDELGEILEHASGDGKTIGEIFDTFNEEQKTVAYAMISHALESADEDNEDDDDDLEHNYDEGDNTMKKNAFDALNNQGGQSNTLTHDQLKAIVADGKRCGSLKESFLAHAEEYGFNPIEVLFPDARPSNMDGPELIKRDTTWVDIVLGEATHRPFSRIRTTVADITADEARAKGYVTGSLKKDEVIPLLKRVTTPTTIYKKQKLDRDDLIDITDFDVVLWLKREMRIMLDEELARQILIGDGRAASDEDKINDLNIRPIVTDDANVYIHRGSVANDADHETIIDEFIRLRKYYKGSGNPTLFVSTDVLTEMLLIKDSLKRRMYKDVTELAAVLRVSKIVEVEPMNTATRVVSEDQENEIIGIMVNMKDYAIGADKGGQVSLFDDFDIDYNQMKYLIETRVSGALIRPKSAIVLERRPAGVAA